MLCRNILIILSKINYGFVKSSNGKISLTQWFSTGVHVIFPGVHRQKIKLNHILFL